MMWFGNVGVNQLERDASAKSGKIVRTLEAGVEYRTPLPPADLAAWHKAAPGQDGRVRWEFRDLPASIEEEKPYQTLFDLAENIRTRKGWLEPDDPLLEELDWVIGQLLNVVIKLHARKQTVGLLHPLNILWYEGPGNKRVLVLPDLGFAWSKTGSKPEWLADVAELRRCNVRPASKEGKEELKFREAWYPDPVTSHHEFNPARDLDILARLIDWIISGEIRVKLPDKEEDPNTQGWAIYTLLEELNRTVTTAAKFWERLTLDTGRPGRPTPTEVSVVFIKPADGGGRPKRRRTGRVVFLTGMMFVLLFAVLFLISRPPKVGEAPNPLCPQLPRGSRLWDLALELHKKLDAPPRDNQGNMDEMAAAHAWLPDLRDVVERATAIVQKEPSEDKMMRAEEEKCRVVMWKLVRDEFDRKLQNYVHVEAKAGFSGTQDQEKCLIRIKRILDESERMKTMSPSENSSWAPSWYDDLANIRNQLERLLRKR